MSLVIWCMISIITLRRRQKWPTFYTRCFQIYISFGVFFFFLQISLKLGFRVTINYNTALVQIKGCRQERHMIRSRQNGRHSDGDILIYFFVLCKNCCTFIPISEEFYLKHPVDHNLALVPIMAWCRQATAIMWTSGDGLINWRVYAPLSVNELRCSIYVSLFIRLSICL